LVTACASATTTKHPKTGKLYTEMVYQPMLEVLVYLRANSLKTFIVSGGGIEFMRPWAEEVYGIPPEQVVGSSAKFVPLRIDRASCSKWTLFSKREQAGEIHLQSQLGPFCPRQADS
jgi:hypothetical protein